MPIRYRVNPRGVPEDKAARRLGLGLPQFQECMPRLFARGFPRPDPDTDMYDLKAIDNWMDRNAGLVDAMARDARNEDWNRAWRWIGPVFRDVAPDTVQVEHLTALRARVAELVSIGEAHRVIKIWRALWQVAAAFDYCDKDKDPSFGFANNAPPPRSQRWREGEAVRATKRAWRMGYWGLAAALAVAWDSQLSPVDVRSLSEGQRRCDAEGTYFELARDKTGVAAIATIGRRAERVLNAYIASLGVELHADAPIFRNRSGRPYSKDTLGDDFRDVRAAEFGRDEKRTIMDFRRSGTLEAFAGNATTPQVSAKMANSISSSNRLHKVYAPVDIHSVRAADAARKIGRQRMRKNTP